MSTPTPLVPRITKSTAVAAIKARFTGSGELLERFELAKEQANLWDGERDGLREAVKSIDAGTYQNGNNIVILSRTETAKVMYPNATGKHQLENCLQTTVPGYAEAGMPIIVLQCTPDTPEELLDQILSLNSKGKEHALEYLKMAWVGHGETVDNAELYEKKGSEKSAIAIIPGEPVND